LTVLALGYSPNGKHLLSGSYFGAMNRWDAATGRLLHRFDDRLRQPFENGLDQLVQRFVISPDGRTIAAGYHGGGLRVWDAASGKELRRWKPGDASPSPVAVAPDGRTLVTTGYGVPCVWDARTGKPLHQLQGHRGSVHSIVYAPDGRTLATAGSDRTVRLWG